MLQKQGCYVSVTVTESDCKLLRVTVAGPVPQRSKIKHKCNAMLSKVRQNDVESKVRQNYMESKVRQN